MTSRRLRRAAFASACAALAAALFPIACSNKSAAPEPQGVINHCTNDFECVNAHCNNNVCVPNCTPTSCPPTQSCGSDGRCANASSGGSGNGGTGPSNGGTGAPPIPIPEGGLDADLDADACATASVDFSVQPPNVMLVVDRSGSMKDDLDPMNQPGLQRWQAAREALVNAMTGVVAQVQDTVNVGLTLYTAPSGNPSHVGHMDTLGTADPDYVETSMCPFLVEVPIAPNNFAAIEAGYRPITMYSDPANPMTRPTGLTPTGEAIQAVIPVLSALDPVLYPGPKAIVLATDGEPNGCTQGGMMGNQGRMNSVNAVQTAFDANITTFVISVGDDVGVDHLREIANIGRGFPADDPMDRFYVATDPAALATALREIFTEVRSCTFMVDGTIDPDEAHTGSITIDGMPITYDDPNGWRVNGESEVEILGTACELIKMGEHSVDIRFPCGVIDPR